MKEIIKILASFPIILLSLYFIPFLGIILILLRFFLNLDKSFKYSITLVVLGTIVFILSKILKYNNFISFSKILIIMGVILIIGAFIFKNCFEKINVLGRKYMENKLKKDYEVRKQNDMKMQEKREKARNTQVVRCPYCGSLNTLTEKIGTCEYCRRKLEGKDI